MVCARGKKMSLDTLLSNQNKILEIITSNKDFLYQLAIPNSCSKLTFTISFLTLTFSICLSSMSCMFN